MEDDEFAEHAIFHSKAALIQPNISKQQGDFCVAVLPHNIERANCEAKDYLWFKVKGKHSVLKLQNAYFKRTNTQAKLCQGKNNVPEETQMRHLNHFNDNLVTFWAYADTTTELDQQNVSASSARMPLQPVVESRSDHVTNTKIKPEPAETKPFTQGGHPAADTGGQHALGVGIKPEPLEPVAQASIQRQVPPYTPYMNISQGTFDEPARPPSAFMLYANEHREQEQRLHPTRSRVSNEAVLAHNWVSLTAAQRDPYETMAIQAWTRYVEENRAYGARSSDKVMTTNSPQHSNVSSAIQGWTPQAVSGEYGIVKQEAMDLAPTLPELKAQIPAPPKPPQNTRLQKIIEEGTTAQLEKEVTSTNAFLDVLKGHLAGGQQLQDAKHWMQQIENLQKQVVETPTIIGVVGNTGAGKSSVINAMLEEERLVPTNCMRACTAVVTEISWNSSEDANAKYRADIEFIQASDWEKDLQVSLKELLDGNGNVSRDCTNAESEAGVAYAKIKAVYPQKTKEQLAGCSVEELMKEPGVREVLGTTKNIEKARAEPFYQALQIYVDSKEKATGDSDKKKEKRQMEFWPLIKVVRIYTKADALSTGAVIVDLPGVHDSNAARAAVAAGYMKQCTGLWICAPINRAVDNKAAKSLLGESFKRQLKYDGTYSRVTFICSKTDDISLMEASDSLGLEEEMAADWAKIDANEKELKTLNNSVKELKESKAVYGDVLNDADDALDVWDKLKEDVEDGKTVFEPSEQKKKRKHSSRSEKTRKKRKSSIQIENDDDDDFINDDDEDSENASGSENEDESSERGEPLTIEVIDAKIAELKDTKKNARRERMNVDSKLKEINARLTALKAENSEIEAGMSAICIEGRNKYSKGAIQQDFAAGIKELDQENAEEEDAENFNPDEDIRDYDEVAHSLPVFCVSSRAYQKLRGRLQRDPNVPGFRNVEETEIPQLQAHCKKLTEAGRAASYRRYLNSLSQLLLSLCLWSQNDGSSINLSDEEKRAEGRFLQSRLQTLEKSLDKAVQDCLGDMKEALSEEIFEHFDHVIQLAIDEAPRTSHKWGAPVNKVDRSQGGYFWATYKAICRRDGVFANAQGPHDFNNQLTEPIMKHLASHWEKAFARKLPQVLQGFTRKSKNLLETFHREIEARGLNKGAGNAGLAMLHQQLRTYENTFVHLTGEMVELITNLQREANREFVPVVARHLASAYKWCAEETGPGQYNRMKAHMNNHVESNREQMFRESCDEVKSRLTVMCRQVEEAIANRTEQVFEQMRRDYSSVVNGSQIPQGQSMPKWERQMRTQIRLAIENKEKEEERQEIQDAVEQEEAIKGSNNDESNNEAAADVEGDSTAMEEDKDPSKQLTHEARLGEDDPFADVLRGTNAKDATDTQMSDKDSSG